ncbi:MAG TPA: non-canonical purine NTP pyrophosphatase [Vicinamibacterales bacterium]|nr:non-canonical purine NTP pyrophosphatase [Vicinamibacterales bacterium]
MQPTRLLVATTNRHKIREIEQLLSGLPLELLTLGERLELLPPEETGQTFAENAREKALYYAHATGELTLAEDSGLEIEALGGAPGVHSARFGGADAPYSQKFALIYRELQQRNALGSPARFVSALALAKGNEILFETEGTVEGRIAPEPKGEGGFGYDPIFFYPPFGQTLAEAGERKSAVSHRAAAIRSLRRFLKPPTASP